MELEDKTFIFGVQFHPEWHYAYDKQEAFKPLFNILIEKALEKREAFK